MYKEIDEAPGYSIYDDGRMWSEKQQKFLSISFISMCARGITKTAYGYIWKFADDINNMVA